MIQRHEVYAPCVRIQPSAATHMTEQQFACQSQAAVCSEIPSMPLVLQTADWFEVSRKLQAACKTDSISNHTLRPYAPVPPVADGFCMRR